MHLLDRQGSSHKSAGLHDSIATLPVRWECTTMEGHHFSNIDRFGDILEQQKAVSGREERSVTPAVRYDTIKLDRLVEKTDATPTTGRKI
jgi:hypothetical protein